jgi:flavodoxin
MKTLVIYKSKTGFVRKYAEWIAEELSADLFPADRIHKSLYRSYDAVIYGGGLYAGGISGIGHIKNNLADLEGKKVIVFASGASPLKIHV